MSQQFTSSWSPQIFTAKYLILIFFSNIQWSMIHIGNILNIKIFIKNCPSYSQSQFTFRRMKWNTLYFFYDDLVTLGVNRARMTDQIKQDKLKRHSALLDDEDLTVQGQKLPQKQPDIRVGQICQKLKIQKVISLRF